MSLRSKMIRMAHANPELRPHLLPLLKQEKKAADSMALLRQAINSLKTTIKNDREFEGELTEEGMAGAVMEIAEAGMKLEYGSEQRRWATIKKMADDIEETVG